MKHFAWIFALCASVCAAQTINPVSQITWPKIVGSGAPTATCQATYTGTGTVAVGTKYIDMNTDPHTEYTCRLHSGTYSWDSGQSFGSSGQTQIDASGNIRMGAGGSSLSDVGLSRSAAGVMSVDGSMAGDGLGDLKARAVTTGLINGIINPCLLSGATADVQLNAALALIPYGGIVDARCYGRSYQTIAATVKINTYATPSYGGSQQIIFDPSTHFSPSSSDIDMFTIDESGEITGLYATLPSGMLYSGSVITVPYEPGYMHLYINDITCDASDETNNDYASGACINLTGSTANGPVSFVSGNKIRCFGLGACVELNNSGSSYVNGNSFSDVISNGSGALFLLNNSGTNSTLDGNIFTDSIGQANGTAHAGIVYSGTATSSNNQFIGIKIWDSAQPINNALSLGTRNIFIGSMDGGYSDPMASSSAYPNQNTYFDTSNVNNTWNILSADEIYATKVSLVPVYGFAESITPSDDLNTTKEIYGANHAGSAYVWWINNDGSANLPSLTTGSVVSSGSQSVSISGAGWTLTPVAGGSTAGNFTIAYSGSTSSTGTITINLPTAPHGWTCSIGGQPFSTSFYYVQTGYTATAATISAYTSTGPLSGASGIYSCTGF